MCDYYPGCDHDEQPNCVECGATLTLDGHGDTKIASLQGKTCMDCDE